MNDLAGKVALVTGASRGIGEAVARELAGHGVAVVLAARSQSAIESVAAEIEDSGGRARSIACDVARFADVESAVAICQKAFGRLDILINNAGIIDPIAKLADSDPDAWARVVDVNYKGVYHGLRAALPVMEAQGEGTVVNLSSGAATSPLEGWSHYCSTKAAVLSLTRCADKEYGDKGIRVVGFSPGTVATDMQAAVRQSGVNPVSQLPWDAHISTESAAKAVVWLCSEGAEEFAGSDFSIKSEEGRRRAGLVATGA